MPTMSVQLSDVDLRRVSIFLSAIHDDLPIKRMEVADLFDANAATIAAIAHEPEALSGKIKTLVLFFNPLVPDEISLLSDITSSDESWLQECNLHSIFPNADEQEDDGEGKRFLIELNFVEAQRAYIHGIRVEFEDMA